MTKTYTPLIIEGKIYVVVDAPDEPIEQENTDSGMAGLYDAIAFRRLYAAYERTIAACTKYPTIEADAPYWKERIGQRVEVEIKHHTANFDDKETITYAIPPQQKQDDGDLWDEVQSRFNAWLFEDGEASLDDIFNELKSNYTLKSKL